MLSNLIYFLLYIIFLVNVIIAWKMGDNVTSDIYIVGMVLLGILIDIKMRLEEGL